MYVNLAMLVIVWAIRTTKGKQNEVLYHDNVIMSSSRTDLGIYKKVLAHIAWTFMRHHSYILFLIWSQFRYHSGSSCWTIRSPRSHGSKHGRVAVKLVGLWLWLIVKGCRCSSGFPNYSSREFSMSICCRFAQIFLQFLSTWKSTTELCLDHGPPNLCFGACCWT